MTLSPKRGNDAAGGSLPRRELPTGLRDGDGSAAGWIPRPQSRPRSQQGGVFAAKRLTVSMRKALSIPRKTCPIWTSTSLVQVATGRIKRIHKLMVSSIYHMKLYFPVSIFLAVDHHIFALLKYSYIYSVLWYNAGRQ